VGGEYTAFSSVYTVDISIPLETGTTQSATFIDQDSFLAKVDIDEPLNDSPVDVYYDYWEGHTTIPDQSTFVQTLQPQTFTTGGIKTRDIFGLDPDTQYSYRAVLENGGGQNELNVVFLTTDPSAPQAPFINSAIDAGYNSTYGGYEIEIDFTNLTSNADRYEGQWSNDNGATWEGLTDVEELSIPFNDQQSGSVICDTNLIAPDQVRIRAVKDGVASDWSNEAPVF
jgi:hypothetical protein